MANAQAQAIGRPVQDVFGPIGRVLGKIAYVIIVILLLVLIVFGAWFGFKYIQFQQETGQLSSTVKHGEVAAEEALSPFERSIKKISPDLYAVIHPETYSPYAIDSVVDTSIERDVGVEILDFKPITSFFRPNLPIRLLGTIKAQGLDRETEIEVYCYLEDYNEEYANDEPIPALLTGYRAFSGYRGVIPKDQAAEFQAQCNFPKGLPAEKQVTSKKAKLIVVYDFATKAYQRTWLLEKGQLDSMLDQGVNPFEIYGIDDNLLNSERKVRSVTSPGPINLGLAIDFPQPLTDLTGYLLQVQIARSFEAGNLQRINSLKILVPATDEVNIDLAGEVDLAGLTQCDFEYAGFSEVPGYKEYKLADYKIEETNQECDKKSLRELALSERDCIEYYKKPLYLCNFVVETAPTTLTSDTIRAEATYSYKIEKERVVDIKALPSEIGQEPVA